MKKLITLLLLCLPAMVSAQTNPAITRWLQNTTVMGRHYVSGNSTPIQDAVIANVQSVKYSATSVYATTNGIPTYVTGPFLDGNPSLASSQNNAIFKFPLNPTQNTGTPTSTTGGNIGIFINGVALFDYRDGVSWKCSTGTLAGGPLGNTGDGVWNRDAVVGERIGFDCSKGHPAMGNYHHHQNPSAFKLDLNVISTVCNLYNSDGLYAIDSLQHSPLLGFAYDGFPIYGAYAYKNADATGGIVRMKSSYTLRSITTRTTYADGTTVSCGPAVSTTYPLGYFREDYQYNATSASTPDYLDAHNGRFCITPEYPAGIYCYFATVNAYWNSAYPYVVGPTFYGNKTALKVPSIGETVTTYPPSTAPYIYIAAYARTICSGTSVNFTSAIYNGGVSPSFQWKKNGNIVGSNSNTYTDNALANGDVITCILTTASSATATSNSITMSVIPGVTPAVAISASASSICPGTNVTFTAVPANGGASPSYQWKKNGNNVGSNSTAYSDNTLVNNDVITCVMTGNAICSTSPNVTSNPITITVNTPPVVTCPGNVTVYHNTPSFPLTGGSPASGTYSGPGVSGGVFDPAAAGAGTHAIAYAYTDGNGCSGNCAFSVIVVPSPANDDAPGAFVLTAGTGCSGAPYTNGGATQSTGEPFASARGSAGYHTVWYKFTAPSGGAVRVSTDYTGGTMGSDTRLAMFSAPDVNNYTTFAPIAGDDDNGVTVTDRSIMYAAGLTPGATYYIQVDGKDAATAMGTFCLTVDELTPAMISAAAPCAAGQALSSVNDNYTGWLSATDAAGKLVALIQNPSGGATTSTYYSALNINAAAVRSDAVSGQKYLDRNFNINNPSVPNVNVRLFILNSELTALQAADPGVTLTNLGATRQTGAACEADFLAANGVNSSLAQTGNYQGAGYSYIQVAAPGSSNLYLHTAKAYLPVKTFLQGAYSSPLSRHKNVTAAWVSVLNANALNQPYGSAPFNYTGTESVAPGFFTSTASSTDLLDWVLLELRDPATPVTVITTRAAFIRCDGRIVDLDGTSDLSFRNIPPGNYHLTIRHRNHLGIRTATSQVLDGTMGVATPALYDFSTLQSQAYQDPAIAPVNAAMKNLGSGVFGLWGGNGAISSAPASATVRASGTLAINDYLYLVTTTLGGNVTILIPDVYNRADMNMDGTVRATGTLANNDYLFLITNVLGGGVTSIITQHQ